MRRTLIRLANPVLHQPAIPQAPSATQTSKHTSSSPQPTQHSTSPRSPQSTSKLRPSNSKSKTPRREPPLSLEHFLLRSRVLGLYRTIIRAIYTIPDSEARKDPIAHARHEFGRNKGVRDTAQIRYLASTGKAEWDGMRRYIDELAVLGKGKDGDGKG